LVRSSVMVCGDQEARGAEEYQETGI